MRKRLNIFLSFFLFWLMLYPIKAQTQLQSLFVGEMQETEQVLKKGEVCIPLAKVNDSLYIASEDLYLLDLHLEEQANCFRIQEGAGIKDTHVTLPDESGQKVRCLSKPLYYDNVQSHLLQVSAHYYVPLWIIEGQWACVYHDEEWQIKGKINNDYLNVIEWQDDGIKNKGECLLHILCEHGFLKDGRMILHEEVFNLEPNEKYLWQLSEEGIYLGTRLKCINGLMIPDTCQTKFEKEQKFLEAYRKAERLQLLETYFPASGIVARMRYSVGKLQEKQEVALLRSEKRAYYWVKDELGEKYIVPFGSVQILGEKGARLPKVTKEEIGEFATLSDIQSETDYLLWTDINRQRTYVLEKREGKWQHLHSFICSSGKCINPTPTGLYKVQYAIPYFGLGKGFRCKNALVFFRDYMYHSILFDKTGQYIKSGQYELGSKASHGCIRLSEQDSRWLYEHIPVHTTVWIR